MSKKSTAAAETEAATVETATEAETAAEAETVTETAAETETAAVEDTVAEEAATTPLMYVGPTIPTFAIQNRVYSEVTADQKAVIKKYPELGNLFIKVSAYGEANRMLRQKKGYIYSAYLVALKVKNGGKK